MTKTNCIHCLTLVSARILLFWHTNYIYYKFYEHSTKYKSQILWDSILFGHGICDWLCDVLLF